MLENFFLILDDTHIGTNVCSESNILKGVRFIGYLLLVARFVVPLIVIGMASIDLVKGVIGGNADSLSKQAKSIAIRIAIGILVFFIPTLIDVVLSAVPQFGDINGEYTKCKNCMLTPLSCSIP